MKRRATLLALALGSLVSGPLAAATLKATLLFPADDARLERSRAERAYLGHPTGPAEDGVQMALQDGQFELDAAGSKVALESKPVAA